MDIQMIWSEAGFLTQVITIALLLYGLGKGIIKIPWLNLKKKEKHTDAVGVHSTCPNFPSLRLLVTNAIEKSAEIQRIQINEAINEQMNEADELFIDIRDILKSNYLKLYRQYNNDEISGLLQKKEVKCYLSMLDNTENLLKGMTRRFVKKNHFLEKTDAEFRIYITERSEDYQKAMSGYLDEHYSTSHFKISREELFESNMRECIPTINKKIETFFYRIRDIARTKQEKVDSLKTQIKDFI